MSHEMLATPGLQSVRIITALDYKVRVPRSVNESRGGAHRRGRMTLGRRSLRAGAARIS